MSRKVLNVERLESRWCPTTVAAPPFAAVVAQLAPLHQDPPQPPGPPAPPPVPDPGPGPEPDPGPFPF
jgi:hypothetical protein